MKSLRSIAFVALALCTSAFIAAPSIAAVPSEGPAYDNIRHDMKSAPATIAVVAAELAVQRCIMPMLRVSTSVEDGTQTACRFRVALTEPRKAPSVGFFRRC
jgi:hypothetical protein